MDNIKKMLIVEDSPADVMLVKIALEEAGVPLKVVHFPDGQEILDFMSSGEPEDISFLLLDLNIPKASGTDILRLKSAIKGWKTVPVIVYSSSTRQEDIRMCIELGANAYICKPVDFSEFNRTILHTVVFWGQLNMGY